MGPFHAPRPVLTWFHVLQEFDICSKRPKIGSAYRVIAEKSAKGVGENTISIYPGMVLFCFNPSDSFTSAPPCVGRHGGLGFRVLGLMLWGFRVLGFVRLGFWALGA